MKRYDFDELIDRHGTDCVKHDRPDAVGKTALWVADMDFRTPDFVMDAMRSRLGHPVLGYTFIPEDYFPTIRDWVFDVHGWKVECAWMRYIPGIVKGIGMVLNCFCNRGDKVIIQSPVYPPFRRVPQQNGLEVVENPLVPVYDDDGLLKTYRMDLEGLERVIDKDTRVLVLSNPHNPCGICWDAGQLEALAEICSRHGIIVISDEIHAEMALEGHRHIPFASVSEAAGHCSITFMAPSKTFNIAGVVSSYAIVPDTKLRDRFFAYLEANEFDSPSILSIVATKAAYTEGMQWRKSMLEYVQANVDFVDDYLRSNIPRIHCTRPDASFLVWLDCRKLSLSQKELVSLFYDKAGLFLNDGSTFGEQGNGFMRLNVGCPRSVLESALESLRSAVEGL